MNMSELRKALLVIIFIAGLIAALLLLYFADEKHDSLLWVLAISSGLLSIGAFSWLLVGLLRREEEKLPDFLGEKFLNWFDQDGLSFTVRADEVDGVFCLHVWFQSRRDRRCRAVVALRPGRRNKGFGNPKIEFEAPPAAFGCASLPIAVGSEFQGRDIALNIGASVSWPDGNGKLVRFQEGMEVGSAPGIDRRDRMFMAGAAMSGGFGFVIPATITLSVPEGVASTISPEPSTTLEISWELASFCSTP
ncbi:MAG: hypothetical protein M0R80_29235 [Proteobacteria bacterium]|nr:hypothetical protein [Pseudomonadota bacterium]